MPYPICLNGKSSTKLCATISLEISETNSKCIAYSFLLDPPGKAGLFLPAKTSQAPVRSSPLNSFSIMKYHGISACYHGGVSCCSSFVQQSPKKYAVLLRLRRNHTENPALRSRSQGVCGVFFWAEMPKLIFSWNVSAKSQQLQPLNRQPSA